MPEDLISREKVREVAQHIFSDPVLIMAVNNVLRCTPAADSWIPVTERLPEYGGRVLATDGVVVGEMYFANTNHWHRYNGISWENFADTHITHWMPLPEPLKEVKE